MSLEIEVKLWIPGDLADLRKRVKALRFSLKRRRVFERNVLFDTSDLRLRQKGEMIRLRRAGKLTVFAFKGPAKPGRHKSREEIECRLEDPDTMDLILARLGYQPVFRYEKFREEYERKGKSGLITLDETPIGNFIELEGAPRWIDQTARELGFTSRDYITRSYGNLYLAHCREHGDAPGDMSFPSRNNVRRLKKP